MDKGCCNEDKWTETCDPFKRICYQYGMLLGVDEFQQEQSYHRSKHRMNQRLFVGYGMVYGGDFSVVKRQKDDGHGKTSEHLFVIVHRLLALDDLGRELWLKEPCEIDLTEWWKANKNTGAIAVQEDACAPCGPPPPKEQIVYVTVGYKHCCTTPVPAVAPPCDDQAPQVMASRIQEGVECQLSRTAPKPPTDLVVARPADVRWADEALKNFAGWVQAMCEDGARPLLLGTLEICESANGTLHVKKCRNHALPRIAMKCPPAFQVVSVHPNLYCREPTLDVRFSMPPMVAPIEGFHVLELRPPGRRHKGGPRCGPPKGGGHHSQNACQDDEYEEEETSPTRCLPGLRDLVDHKGVVCPDECDPTLLRVPLCDGPERGNPYRIIISGTGTSAILTRGLVALNDGEDFTIAFENKDKADTVGV